MDTYTAFLGPKLVATAPLDQILTTLKPIFDHDPGAPILIFEGQTSRQVDFDLQGPLSAVLARALPPPPRTGPGRPKLGVVPREVSLLPRHWEWLEQQPSGASAAIRRLVDDARKYDQTQGRQAVEAAGRFITALAGNLPGYEEASRALYARNFEKFEELMAEWPEDVRRHAIHLACDRLVA